METSTIELYETHDYHFTRSGDAVIADYAWVMNWSTEGTDHLDRGREILPIRRHVKVKSGANPYDPACETYFEKRDGDHMRESFRGTQTLRFLWSEQRGFCPVCNTKITRITGWRLHHCVPRVMGGSQHREPRLASSGVP